MNAPSFHRLSLLHKQSTLIPSWISFFLIFCLFWVLLLLKFTFKLTQKSDMKVFKGRFEIYFCCLLYWISRILHHLSRENNCPKACIASFWAFLCAAEELACQDITHGLWKLGQNEAKDLKVENVHLCLIKHVKLLDGLNYTGCLTWGKEHLYFEIFR